MECKIHDFTERKPARYASRFDCETFSDLNTSAAGTHVVRVFIDDTHLSELRAEVNGTHEQDDNVAISSPVQSSRVDLNTTGYFSLPTDIGSYAPPQSAGMDVFIQIGIIQRKV